ncbi:hypothetical protein PG987_011518 [Apiospora arundinis]
MSEGEGKVPGTVPETWPEDGRKMTPIQERNESEENPGKYAIGAVPGQILSSGMRMDPTSAEYLETVDFDVQNGLRECINSLEVLQMRSKGWLSGGALDIPIMWVYRCQPQPVRHRINLLLTLESNMMFEDPKTDIRIDSRSETQADSLFQRRLENVYKAFPTIWRRIRLREFTIWPIHTTKHFVTLLFRMRHSDPNAHPSSPYDECCQMAILEPTYNNAVVKRLHRRLRRILIRDGIKIAPDHFKSPWYPTQDDMHSCGLRSYRMVKEFMERLTFIYTSYPVHYYATNKPVMNRKGTNSAEFPFNTNREPPSSVDSSDASDMDTSSQSSNPDAGGKGWVSSAQQMAQVEAEFSHMLWNIPFNGWLNESRVRQEMMGAAAAMSLERFDYQARLGIVPIDSMTDRDRLYDRELRLERRKREREGKDDDGDDHLDFADEIDDEPISAAVYNPNLLRPRKPGKIQRFEGRGSINPVQNDTPSQYYQFGTQQSASMFTFQAQNAFSRSGVASINDAIAGLASLSIDNGFNPTTKRYSFDFADLDAMPEAKKQRQTTKTRWASSPNKQKRRPVWWRQTKKPRDRYGPVFAKKVIDSRITKQKKYGGQ